MNVSPPISKPCSMRTSTGQSMARSTCIRSSARAAGRAAVIDVIRQIADNFRVHRFDRESIMLGADTASSTTRYSLTALDSNKPISLRIAHFAQFRAGRLTNFRVLVDTFDLVERTGGLSDPAAADGGVAVIPDFQSSCPARANSCSRAPAVPRLPSPAPRRRGWPGHRARSRAVPGHDVHHEAHLCARAIILQQSERILGASLSAGGQ